MKGCQSLGNEDMISELPDALLLQILSLIPTNNAVATSVLSKRWRFLCKMMPNLSFFYRGNGLESFSDNVCRCLLSNKAPVLQSLHLKMIFEDDSTMDIGVLLGIAFGLHVRELKLEVYSSAELFRFPTSLYNSGTLETLKLGPCVLIDVLVPVCLKALRTLSLFDVSFKDDESVVNLLSGCSVLENLEVEMYTHPVVESFTIAVPSLQRLKLISDSEDLIEYSVNAPSLKYLTLRWLTEDDSCLIENTPELVEANIIDVSSVIYANIHGSLTSAKRLSLEILPPLDLTKFPTNKIFNQLVYLEQHTYGPEWWNLLMLMLHTSPNLQVLKLISHWFRKGEMSWSQPKYVAECLVNRLEKFVWQNYKGEIEDEREVAQYILRNASRLKTATFSKIRIHPEKRLERLKELENVVRASNTCQLVFKNVVGVS